jgi:signal transduction histidine kinase
MEEKEDGEIILTANIENDKALIIYSDNGQGIEPQTREKIFEPFFTTKESGKGTGIGLSIVFGIIQEHNGAITCESEEDNGTIFKISLPLYNEIADNYSVISNA